LESLLALLDETGPRLVRVLTRVTLSKEAAEDLLQELFLKLWQSEAFHRSRDPAAYAYRTAIHLAFDWRRADGQNTSDVDANALAVDPAAASPLAELVKREEIALVLNVLNRLSEKMRDAVVMRHIQQETYETVANHLGTTPHQARSLCHKGICHVRDALAPKFSQPSIDSDGV
jgi:RNA polymerase sigma-70 factor (ECF subfamily)